MYVTTCCLCNYFYQFDMCVHQLHKPTNDYILSRFIHSPEKTLFFIINIFLFEQSKNVINQSDK